jgi:uncharacterized protein YqeY
MKDRDPITRGILSVVLTKAKLIEVELRSKGQMLEEKDVFDVIQKTIKELHDEKEGFIKVNNLERVAAIDKQEAVLNSYLPKQLTKEEVLAIIATLEDKSLPSIMRLFKTQYAGKVNMSLVSEIARSL